MIELVDYHLRLITIGTGLLLLALTMSNEVRAKIKLPLAGMIVGAVFYLISASPLMMAQSPLDPWIDLFSISTPFWIWLFARRLFESEPDPRMLYGAVAVLFVGWIIGNFVPSTWPAGFLILHFALLALIGDVVRVGLFEREDDLVEQRRIIRLWLPALISAQAAGILIFELFELFSGLDGRLPIANLINSMLIMILMLFSGVALLRTDPVLLVETRDDAPGEETAPLLDLSPSESVLHEKLKAAMAQGAYREPGLTIPALAAQLDTPEHRLRALINQRLGHRNFSAFLNRHRIAEAKERLSDKKAVDLPVLTIAMDLGYNSLTPFNRAFREQTGTTPSEFRRLSIANGSDEAGVTQGLQN
ncbi:hypothetical protein CD351_07405 [Erythrobacter sp. KY5]|uniref:AraC family transcriptional regulator n=1 Tax=Erythrobacter sp. KY5 TaxID=2011159 RepID=UPI000DBF26A4|nr:helix-turn-helix domain-containing protein [Erythrobacter sp. KY5]AWW74255.1 hypothetical protein CD351_07405 [Erythrobacter sp. KY5]